MRASIGGTGMPRNLTLLNISLLPAAQLSVDLRDSFDISHGFPIGRHAAVLLHRARTCIVSGQRQYDLVARVLARWQVVSGSISIKLVSQQPDGGSNVLDGVVRIG